MSAAQISASQSSRLLRGILWAAIALGFVLRLRQFFFNRALWLDEAMLALHLTTKSATDLLRPLAEPLQIAPPGFLLATAWLRQCAPGPVEMGLRMFPLASGLAALVLFAWFCRRRLAPASAVLATVLFAISQPLIRYSTEVKQYGCDVLAALLTLVLVSPCLTEGLSRRRAAVLACAGSVLVWMSHPVSFVLLSSGLVLAFVFWRARNWRSLALLGAVGLAWAISAAVFYVVAIRPNAGLAEVQEFHRGAFLPFPPASLGDARWFVQAFFGLMLDPGGFSAPVLAGLVGIFGVAWSQRFSRAEKFLLLLPGGCALIASGLHRYPFDGRLLLFFAPALILFVAEGAMCCVAAFSGSRLRWLLPAALLLHPAGNALELLAHPMEYEEIRPVLQHLAAHALEGDTVFVHHEAKWAFEFYRGAFPLPARDVRHAPWSDSTERYLPQLRALKGLARVWLVFSHTSHEEEARLLLLCHALGTERDHVQATGASAWLFDFSTPLASSSLPL